MPDKLRLRFNAANMGASQTRNKLLEVGKALLLPICLCMQSKMSSRCCLLTSTTTPTVQFTSVQESLAEYVLFLDDDVEPQPHCVAAYIHAMQDPHNSEVGQGGPSFFIMHQTNLEAMKDLRNSELGHLVLWLTSKLCKIHEIQSWAIFLYNAPGKAIPQD